jgi:sugar phosphate permease
MQENQQSNYKWVILALITGIAAFVAAFPASGLPVLFAEIARDLNLTLVQIGTVWGATIFAGIFVSLLAGALSDRFRYKTFLGFACVLVGITGALRGISTSFFMLLVTVFLNGIIRLMVPITISKAVGVWFKGKNLGISMGISTLGIGIGLTLGPLISATILSPWLGGWRHVMYFYGAISALVGILWFVFGRERPQNNGASASSLIVPFRQAFPKLIRNKALWLLGFAIMARNATLIGFTGYLPLYLRSRGWETAQADSTLAMFYAASMICVIPLSLISDKLGSRKAILLTASIMSLICISLLPFVGDGAVWLLVVLTGLSLDVFMALLITMVLETKGIGPAYSGVALGIVFTFGQIGGSISPPLGNSLATVNQALPFLFWGSLSIITIIMLAISSETGRRRFRGELSDKTSE